MTNYADPIPDYGDVITVAQFNSCVSVGGFVDYDGYGYPARHGRMDIKIVVSPSLVGNIPEDATHIVWFNK